MFLALFLSCAADSADVALDDTANTVDSADSADTGDSAPDSGTPSESEGDAAGECTDGADNDRDGAFDCDDEDCAGSTDCAVDDYEGDESGECTDGSDNDDDGAMDCNDDGCAGGPDCEDLVPTVAVTWTDSGVTIDITNGNAAGYDFGMAETRSDAGWFGEDCVLDPDDDADFGYEICHHLLASGGSLEGVRNAEEVVAGESTLFSESLDDNLTYVLFEADGPACWTWGDDVSYYRAFGCVEDRPRGE